MNSRISLTKQNVQLHMKKCKYTNNKKKEKIQQSISSTRMGCQKSIQQTEIISITTQSQTQTQFQIDYRDLVAQDRGPIYDLYTFSTVISRSKYSVVRKVITKCSNINRVCKVISFKNGEYFSMLKQVEFLRKLDHPNIIQIIQYFLQSHYLYIILEEIPGNRLLTQLKHSKNTLNIETLVFIIKQILSAIDFCHRKEIVHRCITPQNVLLIWKDNVPIIKIIDFSQASVIGCPVPDPIPPEKRYIEMGQNQYFCGKKLDVFDCGFLIFCIMMSKKVSVEKGQQIKNFCIQQIKKLSISEKYSTDLQNLLSKMLNQNPYERPQISQCLNHQFFKNFSKKRPVQKCLKIQKSNQCQPIQIFCQSSPSKQSMQKLLEYQSQSRLMYLISMYSSLHMASALKRSQYLMQFYNLDTNKDGQIQLQQLTEGLIHTFNFTKAQALKKAEQIFKKLDKNRNGTLSFSQFVAGTMKMSKQHTIQSLEAMFNQMDYDKNGYVNQREINKLLEGIDRKHLLNGKKKVNFEEFKAILMDLIQKSNKDRKKRSSQSFKDQKQY